jgi:homoserine O-acetyltransferase
MINIVYTILYSGPSSYNPVTGEEYGTTFPLVSVEDMVAAQFLLLDYLGVDEVNCSIGSSLGGMQAQIAAANYSERVKKTISISSCAQSHPSSIAMRYIQRRIIMADPNWKNGHYYGQTFPVVGMQHARELGTISYRSGPEWDMRFGNKRANSSKTPDFCPDFLIETYLDKQGEKFCTSYDPNSLLYISKAMDLFDMGDGYSSLVEGLSRVKCPILVMGVTTDILFPIHQQRELARLLKAAGNNNVVYYELDSIFGHDTFLIDIDNVGSAIRVSYSFIYSFSCLIMIGIFG